MGIRIHTVMGYGLIDVQTKDDKIIDDRFNPDGMVLANYNQ